MSFLIAALLASATQVMSADQAFATPPPPVADPMTADEIVVTAQRLKKFRAVIRTERKTESPLCDIKRSSGDAAFDTRICTTMIACDGELKQSASIRALVKSGAKKRAIARAAQTEVQHCMSRSFEREFGVANPF